MLTVQSKPLSEIKRSVRAMNPRVLFLNNSFNSAFIGMQDDVENSALVPVYNLPQTLMILKRDYHCSEEQASSILKQLLKDYADQGRLCPIFITVMAPPVSRRDNPIFQAALAEYSFDPETIVKLQEKR